MIEKEKKSTEVLSKNSKKAAFTLLEMLISLILCALLLLFLYRSYAFVARELNLYELQKEKRISSVWQAKFQTDIEAEKKLYPSEFWGKVIFERERERSQEEICFP